MKRILWHLGGRRRMERRVQRAIAGDLLAYQMNAWDDGMLAHSQGLGSDANPYRRELDTVRVTSP